MANTPAPLSPDCRDGNCHKCNSIAWDEVEDVPVVCACTRCRHD